MSDRTVITYGGAPAAIGPYSQAVQAGKRSGRARRKASCMIAP